MDMKRREFLKLAGLFSLAAFADLPGLLADISGHVKTIIRYPGKIRPLDEAEIASMGKWIG